jgi:two-component system, chemotaxis family, chemotaxis protein CheY
MKILVVDDSGMIRSVLKKYLSDLGVKEFAEAADGVLALKAVTAHKIDLIFMDWNMPNLSGIEALKKLKANAATRSIPVIMVTSESEKAHILEAVKAGAANYVIKPFSPAVIKEKMAPYLAAVQAEAPKDSAGQTASEAPAAPPPAGEAGKSAA